MSDIFGIRQDGAHWLCFDDSGDHPGKFEDREAARWGTLITPENAARINEGEGRLITSEDVQAAIRARLAAA